MTDRQLHIVDPDGQPQAEELSDLDDTLGPSPQELAHEPPRD